MREGTWKIERLEEDGGQNLWALYHFTGLAASPLAVRRAGSHDELWHSTRSTLDER